jgi:hypothetical protein
MRIRLIHIALLAGLLTFATPVRAALSFSLTPAMVTDAGSNEVVFIGALTNSSLTNVYLNNIQFSLTNAATNYLTGDTNIFFQNLPGIFVTNETYSSDIVMGVYINPATPVGTYSGTASVDGGGDEFATNDLADVSFQISLAPPVLGVALSSTNLALTWSLPPGGLIVEQITNLMAGSWTTNTLSTFTNGTTEGVNITPGPGNSFFRLSTP